ncbi:hypothetical protein GTO91_06165 [Heliobacterium undosum]|uniref:Lipoprotein n=1 Tax=Heliomicrobium undosum TaxID=121734 RepID=A0A845L8N8_9FIRM|nr:hypothetical protein [Heliomicrobium undosum]MZP29291.1 hypothetical protein [Heliomicrobium undosum]
MRRRAAFSVLWLMMGISLLLAGCGLSTAKGTQVDHSGAGADGNRQGQPAIVEIDFVRESTDYFVLAEWMSEERLAVGIQEADSEIIKVFAYDLSSNKRWLLFEGKTSRDDLRVKRLNEKRAALFTAEKILLLNTEDPSIHQEIPLPKGVTQPDISYREDKVCYIGKEGLYVSDAKFQQPRLLLERKEWVEDERGQWRRVPNRGPGMRLEAPVFPRWSYDDQKILYRRAEYEGYGGVGVIKPDGSGAQYFEVNDLSYAYWLKDSVGILCGRHVVGEPAAYLVDTAKHQIKTIDDKGDKREPRLGKNDEQIIYSGVLQPGEPGNYLPQLVLMDLKTGATKPFSPVFHSIDSFALSPSGDKVIVVENTSLPQGGVKQKLWCVAAEGPQALEGIKPMEAGKKVTQRDVDQGKRLNERHFQASHDGNATAANASKKGPKTPGTIF